jgi:hypothetical protein
MIETNNLRFVYDAEVKFSDLAIGDYFFIANYRSRKVSESHYFCFDGYNSPIRIIGDPYFHCFVKELIP